MMALSLVHPIPSRAAPKPLHNEAGTIRSLAKQMLMDIDRASLTTAVPTATLELLLTTLVDALDRPTPAPPAVSAGPGAMQEATSNPNLAHWIRRAAEDLDAADE